MTSGGGEGGLSPEEGAVMPNPAAPTTRLRRDHAPGRSEVRCVISSIPFRAERQSFGLVRSRSGGSIPWRSPASDWPADDRMANPLEARMLGMPE